MAVVKQEQSVWVVIPAAGVGSRMESDIPKQYIKLQGKTILEHTVSRFTSFPQVAGILVVIGESDVYWPELEESIFEECQRQDILFSVTHGGKDRSDTVFNGLTFLLNNIKIMPNQWVMVHDAARPCVRRSDLLNLLAKRIDIDDGSGALLAVPVRDTLKLSNKDKKVIDTPSREDLWQAQTPQLFRLASLLDALDKARRAHLVITDEASVVEYSNKTVHLVQGSSDNIKLTTPSDLAMIDFLLKNIEE